MPQLLKNLPIGSKVRYGRHVIGSNDVNDITWLIAAKNHVGYPAGSVTLMTENIIDQRAVDAKEINNPDEERKSYGNNRYLHSNIRQWLNSDSHPWFGIQHTYDVAPSSVALTEPTGYDNVQGFLSLFEEKEKLLLKDTSITLAKNNKIDGGGSEIASDKVFLASATEIGATSSAIEGALYPIFTNDDSRKAKMTEYAFNYTNAVTKPPSKDFAFIWALRTPSLDTSSAILSIDSIGKAIDTNRAYHGHLGLRPVCNIDSDVYAVMGEDGVYDILYTDVVRNDLTLSEDNTTFRWEIRLAGDHTGVKSQVEILDENDNIVATSEVLDGSGNKSAKAVPIGRGHYKARVKLTADTFSTTYYSNVVSYYLSKVKYRVKVSKPVNILAGDRLNKIPFVVKQDSLPMTVKVVDRHNIVMGIDALITATKANISIEGKHSKLDKLAYIIKK